MRPFYATILLLLPVLGAGQKRPAELDSLLGRLAHEKKDTVRANILLQLDSIYYDNHYYKGDFIDSAILLTQQVMSLGRAWRDDLLFQRASLHLVREFVIKKDIPAAKGAIRGLSGEFLVKGLVQIGEYYAFKPGQLPENLDSAAPYIRQALSESQRLPTRKSEHEALALLGKWYYERGELRKGVECFMRVIREFHDAKDTANEGLWWEELGIYLPDTDSTFAWEIHAYDSARKLLQAIGDFNEEQSADWNMGYVYQLHGMNDSAERWYLRHLELMKRLGKKNLVEAYADLVVMGLAMGNYQKCIYYGFEAIKNSDSAQQYALMGILYFHLGEAYLGLGDLVRALEWYRRSLKGLIIRRTEYVYSVANRIAGCLVAKGKPREALLFLQEFKSTHPSSRHSDHELLAAGLGECFYQLGDFRQAEENYLSMITADSLARKQRGREIFRAQSGSILNTSSADYILGRFYFLTGNYQKAVLYLEGALKKDDYPAPLVETRDIHLYLFKTDSALGHFREAIKELNLSRVFNDSIFTIAKNNQLQELQVKYDLNQQQQAIQLLQKDRALQQNELQRSRQARNFILVLVALLAAGLGVAVSRYRLKQRLVKEKDMLIDQKEWLVREIHHRVKNNLQIVISLLSTQAKFLTNEEAVSAIQQSRHRMHAVSLIHQKLFQSEDSAFVSMQTYIEELVGYLRSMFDASGRIKFSIHVDPVELDLSQAIPLGLVLNEAVTNAIKYAFPGGKAGTLAINMHNIGENGVELNIHDDGRGLPVGFDLSRAGSMGMRLMRGLTKQIGGTMSIKNDAGVSIEIRFTKDVRMKRILATAGKQKK